jgi:aminoglycoside 6-adenylyltransferase
MFMRMIAWHIGTETGFSVSFGKEGRFMKNHLDAEDYKRILETYPDYKTENIWMALFQLTGLFSRFAGQVSDKLHFELNCPESENVFKYLRQQYAERK